MVGERRSEINARGYHGLCVCDNLKFRIGKSLTLCSAPVGDPKAGVTIFGMFDGHNGRFDSGYVAAHFSELLEKRIPFRSGT